MSIVDFIPADPVIYDQPFSPMYANYNDDGGIIDPNVTCKYDIILIFFSQNPTLSYNPHRWKYYVFVFYAPSKQVLYD